jgi:enterochelin esterase-like enzyme
MKVRFMVLVLALLPIAATADGRAAQERALTNEFRVHPGFASEFVSNARDIIVWLPPGYGSDVANWYPVLYMQDGANAFASWRIDETAKALIASGEIEPLIIVLIPTGGTQEARFDEYTPTRPSNARAGGKADFYGRMLVEELKPFIDSKYRTLEDAANTALGGASLGGLVSLYLGLTHPTVFGKLAVISPSVWWDDRVILRNVRAVEPRPAMRIWLDIGTEEPGTSLRDARQLRDALVRKGWELDSDLMYFEADGGTHDEASFARRAESMLRYLFPPQ